MDAEASELTVRDMRMLDPMPPRLREAMGAYEVTDTSPLSLAARAGEAAG
ncbi:hypothetical protein [Bradyrhizobium sp. AUGA SZCCT0283]|nr:hypothetical protein [Bradyrhizobium sp. AUGA SZCCT0283]MBR1274251.1 hypothetical protein [Bradyrhizobium sp. AUGA SZCCT0283]